jgi:hypothetical protein
MPRAIGGLHATSTRVNSIYNYVVHRRGRKRDDYASIFLSATMLCTYSSLATTDTIAIVVSYLQLRRTKTSRERRPSTTMSCMVRPHPSRNCRWSLDDYASKFDMQLCCVRCPAAGDDCASIRYNYAEHVRINTITRVVDLYNHVVRRREPGQLREWTPSTTMPRAIRENGSLSVRE